ncbi:MAG: sel1 repeat family protein [bacterium]|nr:sel1 repeat family protein [bacterium]
MNTKIFAYTLILTFISWAGLVSPALQAAEPETDNSLSQLRCAYEQNSLLSYDSATEACIKAAERGDAKAQDELGYRYETGTGVPKNELEALGWYLKASKQNYGNSTYRIGYFYEHGMAGLKKDHKYAVAFYKKSAEQGSPFGQGMYALYLYDGLVVKQDREAAVYWMKKSAANGSEHAKKILKKWGVTP